MARSEISKIVLAYSGGLDTTVALRWLRENYNADVVAYCADIGQPGDLTEVRRKAEAGGASEVVIEDLQEQYITDFIFPALRAGALYEGQYTMAAPLGRPLIAKRLAEIALEVNAEAVAHGSTGKGNDQVRFFSGVAANAPHLEVLAPCIDWELKSRDDEIAYAQRHGLEIATHGADVFSVDGSLWGTSTECGSLEDPGTRPPDNAFQITRSPADARRIPESVAITFDQGTPVALNGEALAPVALVERLSRLGGEHAIGRVDIVENSMLGIKTRAIYESPAGFILHRAHRELEALTLERDVLHFKQGVSQRYSQLVYFGQWFSALRPPLDAFVDHTQQVVSGTIELQLFRGNMTVNSRRAERSLFHASFSAHDDGDIFDHDAAPGFAYIASLPQRIQAVIDEESR